MDFSYTELCNWLSIPDSQFLKSCTQQNFQASGAGGQKRNKVHSAIRLIWLPGGLVSECAEYREVQQNIKAALFKLKKQIALFYHHEIISQPEKFPGSKGRIDSGNSAYPLFIKKITDRIYSQKGELKLAAEDFGLSTSAICRLLFKDKDWLATIQNIRIQFNKPPLNSPGK